jgi:isoleucyl-tRNA synthetase
MAKGGNMDYKSTVNLPTTSFQMKANLPQREPEFVKFWLENKFTKKLYPRRIELKHLSYTMVLLMLMGIYTLGMR